MKLIESPCENCSAQSYNILNLSCDCDRFQKYWDTITKKELISWDKCFQLLVRLGCKHFRTVDSLKKSLSSYEDFVTSDSGIVTCIYDLEQLIRSIPEDIDCGISPF